MTEEVQWLRDYATKRCDESFRRLVDRYINLVYSSARRQVKEEELARDVTQAVFLILAEKAGQLDTNKPLSAWLMQVTRYASANAVRSRARRVRHEQKAAEMNQEARVEGEWESMSPLLDEGMSRLRSGDRDVLLLRFFEKKTAREVAEAMGISEDAAEKRVSRAVERLRDFFRRRGVVVSNGALVTGLAAHSAEAAPIGLSAGISAAGATGGVASVAKGTVIAMAAAKTKSMLVTVVIGLLALGGGSAAVLSYVKSPKVVKVPVPPKAATTSPANAWTVTFADGTRVELVAITDTPGKPTRWWKPDGEPIAASLPVPPATGEFTVAGHTTYQFIFRQVPFNTDVDVELTTPTAGATTENILRPGRTREIDLMAAIQSDVKEVELTLSASSAPWKIDWRYDLAARSTTAPANKPPDVSVGKIHDEGGSAHVELDDRHPLPGPCETAIAIVTAKREMISAVRINHFPGRPTVHEFDAPSKDIVAIVRRSRPLEMLKIRNVSLRSGTKTSVTTQPAAP